MTLYDKRKQTPFYLTSRGTVYKPQPSGKALLRAAGVVIGCFTLGVLALIFYMLGVRF
jgi:hypothetical protein